MSARLVIALSLLVGGCRSGPPEAAAPPAAVEGRRLYLPPAELDPAAPTAAGRRFVAGLEARVREKAAGLGHRLVDAEADAQWVLRLGLGLEFHPGGDVKVARIFVRLEEGSTWLDDWVAEPRSFYLMPPGRADLEHLSDEVVARLAEASARTR